MISRRRATGRWSFSFLGANQDVPATTARLNIAPSQQVTFQPTEHGTIGGWKQLGRTMVMSVQPAIDLDAAGMGTVFPGRRGGN